MGGPSGGERRGFDRTALWLECFDAGQQAAIAKFDGDAVPRAQLPYGADQLALRPSQQREASLEKVRRREGLEQAVLLREPQPFLLQQPAGVEVAEMGSVLVFFIVRLLYLV
jgi:hypothetical protein